ncbi:hypothetical protein Mgra_00007283, partial [Meloidogyne graminicola]
DKINFLINLIIGKIQNYIKLRRKGKSFKIGIEMKEEKKSYVLFREELKKANKTGYICKKYGDINQCGCLIEGKIPSTFIFPYSSNKNGKEIFKITTLPSCGNEFYDIMKTMRFEMLVLLDGCASCKHGGMITGLRITHLEESGGLLSKCNEIKEFEAFESDNLQIRIPEDSSFTLPFILFHRVCEHVFLTLVPSNKYLDIKLHISYTSLLNKNCNNIKGTKIVNLPSIDVSAYKERVVEMRGISVNLDDGNVKQIIRKDDLYTEHNKLGDWVDGNSDCWINEKNSKFVDYSSRIIFNLINLFIKKLI